MRLTQTQVGFYLARFYEALASKDGMILARTMMDDAQEITFKAHEEFLKDGFYLQSGGKVVVDYLKPAPNEMVEHLLGSDGFGMFRFVMGVTGLSFVFFEKGAHFNNGEYFESSKASFIFNFTFDFETDVAQFFHLINSIGSMRVQQQLVTPAELIIEFVK